MIIPQAIQEILLNNKFSLHALLILIHFNHSETVRGGIYCFSVYKPFLLKGK